jgi:hypothetical protein
VQYLGLIDFSLLSFVSPFPIPAKICAAPAPVSSPTKPVYYEGSVYAKGEQLVAAFTSRGLSIAWLILRRATAKLQSSSIDTIYGENISGNREAMEKKCHGCLPADPRAGRSMHDWVYSRRCKKN